MKEKMKKRDGFFQRRLFYNLEHEEISRETWKEFISAYVNQISIRPWLIPGSLIRVKPSHLQPENPLAIYGIILPAGNYSEDEISYVIETLVHELIHINFHVVRLDEHSEEEVERLCKILAKKYPFIADVFREVFAEFTLDEKIFADALSNPIRIFLPTS